MGKGIKITIGDKEATLVAEIRDGQGRTDAEVVEDCFRRGLPLVVKDYYEIRTLQGKQDSLRLLLLRLAAGEQVPDAELAELDHDLEVPVEVLKKIKQCLLNGGSKERARVHKS